MPHLQQHILLRHDPQQISHNFASLAPPAKVPPVVRNVKIINVSGDVDTVGLKIDVKAGDAISCGNGDSVDACGPSCLQCPSDPPLGSATCILGVCGLQCMRSAGVVDGMCVPDP